MTTEEIDRVLAAFRDATYAAVEAKKRYRAAAEQYAKTPFDKAVDELHEASELYAERRNTWRAVCS